MHFNDFFRRQLCLFSEPKENCKLQSWNFEFNSLKQTENLFFLNFQILTKNHRTRKCFLRKDQHNIPLKGFFSKK